MTSLQAITTTLVRSATPPKIPFGSGLTVPLARDAGLSYGETVTVFAEG